MTVATVASVLISLILGGAPVAAGSSEASANEPEGRQEERFEEEVELRPVVDPVLCRQLLDNSRGQDGAAVEPVGPCAPDDSAEAVGSCLYFGAVFGDPAPWPASLVGGRLSFWEIHWYCTNPPDPILFTECNTAALTAGAPSVTGDADVSLFFYACYNVTLPSATVRGAPTMSTSNVFAVGESGSPYVAAPVTKITTVP